MNAYFPSQQSMVKHYIIILYLQYMTKNIEVDRDQEMSRYTLCFIHMSILKLDKKR